MSRTEQNFWRDNDRWKLLKAIATKFLRSTFFSSESTIESIEAIEASVRQQCRPFLDLVHLLETHLFAASSKFDRMEVENVEFWLDELRLDVDPSLVSFPRFTRRSLIALPSAYAEVLKIFHRLRCSSCEKLLTDPIVCLVCGQIFSRKRAEQNCCDERIRFVEKVRSETNFSSLTVRLFFSIASIVPAERKSFYI